MILLSHPTGNEYIRNGAQAFEEAGWLSEFWTALAWREDSLAARFFPAGLRAQLARRAFPGIPAARLHTAPVRELGRFLLPRLGLHALTRHEHGPFSVDGVYRACDAAVARRLRRGAPELRAVYAGEDGAYETFRAARALGLERIYDLPIGYWRAARAILGEEAERQPEWAATLTGLQDSPAKLERKDAELAEASLVVVASSFTAGTLDASLRTPVAVVPYGAPAPAEAAPSAPGERLRVLFAGSLSQRKGLSYLLDAVRELEGRVELTLLGRKAVENCAVLDAAVARHRWIPSLPHAGVLAEMARHDVLVFPSLFEGFGMVITEALSQGLPVITTAHTAGPDLLTEGVDGFLVPVRCSGAIAEKLLLLAGDPERLRAMKEAARATARQRTWAGYRRGLRAAVAPLLQPASPAAPALLATP